MTDLRTISGVELMRVGAWDCSTGPWTCTPEHIAEAVRAGHDVSLTTPVVKLGHTDPRFDGTPAFGQVQNLRASADGQVLLGDLVNVPAWLADDMPSSYPNRSIEGLHNLTAGSGFTYGFALTGLALLGATAPGVQGLAEIPGAVAAAGARSGRVVVLERRAAPTPPTPPVAAVTSIPTVKAATMPYEVRATYDEQARNENLVQAAISQGRTTKGVAATSWRKRLNGLTGAALRAEQAQLQATPVLASLHGPRPAADPYVQIYGGQAQPSHVRAAAPGSREQTFTSEFDSYKRVTYDPYGPNPMLEDLKQASPAAYKAALKKAGPPPTLFESGDLPPFTASGIEPGLLMKLPWHQRHRAAEEPDRAKLLRLFDDTAAKDGDTIDAMEGRAEGAWNYVRRMSRWASGFYDAAPDVQRVMDHL